MFLAFKLLEVVIVVIITATITTIIIIQRIKKIYLFFK